MTAPDSELVWISRWNIAAATCDRVLMWRLDQFVTTNEMQVFAALMSSLFAILFYLLTPACLFHFLHG